MEKTDSIPTEKNHNLFKSKTRKWNYCISITSLSLSCRPFSTAIFQFCPHCCSIKFSVSVKMMNVDKTAIDIQIVVTIVRFVHSFLCKFSWYHFFSSAWQYFEWLCSRTQLNVSLRVHIIFVQFYVVIHLILQLVSEHHSFFLLYPFPLCAIFFLLRHLLLIRPLVYHHSNWNLTKSYAKNDKHDAHCLPPAQFSMETCIVYTNSIFIFYGSQCVLFFSSVADSSPTEFRMRKKYVNKMQNAVHILSFYEHCPHNFFLSSAILFISRSFFALFDNERRWVEQVTRRILLIQLTTARVQDRKDNRNGWGNTLGLSLVRLLPPKSFCWSSSSSSIMILIMKCMDNKIAVGAILTNSLVMPFQPKLFWCCVPQHIQRRRIPGHTAVLFFSVTLLSAINCLRLKKMKLFRMPRQFHYAREYCLLHPIPRSLAGFLLLTLRFHSSSWKNHLQKQL